MQAKAIVILPFAATAALSAGAPSTRPAAIELAQRTAPAIPSTQPPARPIAPPAASPPSASSIAYGLSQWNALRQTDSLPFASYASFLTRFRGWPGETSLRRTAERAIDPVTSSQGDVVAFFRTFPPLTAAGRARHAFALLATGQAERARAEAREAWRMGTLPRTDESRLLGMLGTALTVQDHDQRMEQLLADGDKAGAQRILAYTSGARRPFFEARLAMQTNAADAAIRLALLGPGAATDAGVLMDQANWLRNGSQGIAARALLARPRPYLSRPADPEKWYEALLSFARGAAADKQWTLAYQIASQVDDAYPAGTDVSLRPTGERDDYTSLVWLAGTTALQKLNRPSDAAAMFVRYAKGGRSAQVLTKGYYWAGRAAQAAGQQQLASSYFALAATSPELFYGQLALERLGRPVPPPPAVSPLGPPTAAERAAFQRRDVVAAARALGAQGRWEDQSQFVRALAEQAATERERVLTAELASQIGRPDLAVWVARNARNAGTPFYTRASFPQVRVPGSFDRYWSLAHGIIRQESSFDRAAVSHAGARGMMQLMPGTARQTAGKLSMPYELGRLTRDTDYNIMLGSSYFAELMDYWGGYAPLAIASYNAGPGNVRKWIAANGDPRMPGVDVVRWIEDIPFLETRGYVQRVLENTVVYDTINPRTPNSVSMTRLSFYLGKASQPG